MLNSADLARSVIGRVPPPGTERSLLPFAFPVITLIFPDTPLMRPAVEAASNTSEGRLRGRVHTQRRPSTPLTGPYYTPKIAH